MGIDDDVRSIPALAQWAAARYRGAEAVVDGETRLTFLDLAERALRATRATIAAGIEPGDRVAIWAPNRWEWIVAALGALGAGAWLVPVNTRFKGDEAAYILAKADAAALFTVDGFLGADYVGMLRECAPELRCLGRVVLFDAPARTGTVTFDEFLAAADAVSDDDARARIDAITPGDVADVIFTSGTTGRPKGVMLEHGASLHAFDLWSDRFGLREGDRYLIVNPFFHCFGYKAGWMACLIRGATALPLAVLDVDRLLQLIERERVSALPGPPTLFTSLLDNRDAGVDLSSLRIGFVGASTVAPELLHRVRSELPFEALTTGYGLTETTAMVSITHPDDPPEEIAFWNGGSPLPGIEVAIVDDGGRRLPPDETGEILVRGFPVIRGYFDDPAATAAPSAPTAGCAPATSGPATRSGRCASPTERRTSTSPAASTSRPRRWRTSCWGARRSRRSRWWACPTTAWGRSVPRSSSLGPRGTHRRRRDRLGQGPPGELQGPRGWNSSTPSP